MVILNTGKFGTYFKDEINNIDLTNEMVLGRLNAFDLLLAEIRTLKDREAKLIEALRDIAKTDVTNSVDSLWLSKWRNETKIKADEVLKQMGIEL